MTDVGASVTGCGCGCGVTSGTCDAPGLGANVGFGPGDCAWDGTGCVGSGEGGPALLDGAGCVGPTAGTAVASAAARSAPTTVAAGDARRTLGDLLFLATHRSREERLVPVAGEKHRDEVSFGPLHRALPELRMVHDVADPEFAGCRKLVVH